MPKREKSASHTSARQSTRRTSPRKPKPPPPEEVGVDAGAIPTPEAMPEIVDLPVPPPPELTFASRVPPPEPERPRPQSRRAVFFDVENTSRASDVKRMLEQL